MSGEEEEKKNVSGEEDGRGAAGGRGASAGEAIEPRQEKDINFTEKEKREEEEEKDGGWKPLLIEGYELD